MKNKFNEYVEKTGEIGFAEMVVHPIVKVSGLPGARPEEVVFFESGEMGQVLSLDDEVVEVLVLSKKAVAVGTRACRIDNRLGFLVGEGLLGSTIDPLGNSLYGYESQKKESMDTGHLERQSVHADPLGIARRKKITKPLETGVTVVDLMVPLGKGQRELVLGDKKTGKSNFIFQTIYKQASLGTICIYAAIGKRKTDILRAEEFFKSRGIRDKTVIVGSSSSGSLGMIYLTPYVAMTLAEYFRDRGKDTLVVMDDMSTHAKYYREISLLARRFPGRNSYPGDIFYTHAKVIERAGNFIHNGGEVSISCLPVAETIEGDISGYISTNLMSMTDGHIYFDKDLFIQGRIPSVNYFLSVTRVGRQTQNTIRWGISRELNTFLTLLEDTKSFVHFGAELNEGIKATLDMGDKVLSFFNQGMSTNVDLNLQIVLFALIWSGVWEGKDKAGAITNFEKIIRYYQSNDAYRKKINTLVESSENFNALLGNVAQKVKELTEVSV